MNIILKVVFFLRRNGTDADYKSLVRKVRDQKIQRIQRFRRDDNDLSIVIASAGFWEQR